MKRTLLIVFLLIIINLSFIGRAQAQAYRPMAVDSAHWIVKLADGGMSWAVLDLWEYYCLGDTVIEDIAYKKVFRRELEPTMDPPPFTPVSSYNLYGFLRDDTLNKKVYARSEVTYYNGCQQWEETMLFDFSQQIGDTLMQCNLPYFYEDTLSSITNEVVFDIATRVFTTYWSNFSYYEGIGSQFGLFEEMFMPIKSTSELEFTQLYYYCPDNSCGYVLPDLTLLTVGEVFDFEVGDEFQFHNSAPAAMANADRINITGKYYSAEGDTVFYSRFHHSYTSSLNQNPGDRDLVYNFYTFDDTVFYTNLQAPISVYDENFLLDGYIANYNHLCDSTVNGYYLIVGPGFEDDNISNEYGKGLGLTKSYFYSGTGGVVQNNNNLFYYRKGSETCGVPDVVSVKDIPDGQSMVIFPNPAEDFIQFNLELPKGSGSYILFNCQGKEILTGRAVPGLNTINLVKQPQGIYFLRIIFDGQVSINKIVKN